MKQEERARLRQLLQQAVPQLLLNSRHRLRPGSDKILEPVVEFVSKAFSYWVHQHFANRYVFMSVEASIFKLNLRHFQSFPPAEQKRLVDEVCDFWDAIPATHTFAFPLPACLDFDANTVI